MMVEKSNVDLICDIAELAGMFERSSDLGSFLQSTVSMVAHHMKAAVCSIYLLQEDKKTLLLQANQGLSASAVGNIRLKVGEGITGKAVSEMKAIREGRGSSNPDYKPIPGIYEEQYEAFLAVPIIRGLTRVGALVVQDPELDYFDQNDEKALRAIASQLATTLEYARLFISLHGEDEPYDENEPVEEDSFSLSFIKGGSASPGFAIGNLFKSSEKDLDLNQYMEYADRPLTIEDFVFALDHTEDELERLQIQLGDDHADFAGLIFSAHLLILKDIGFSGRMRGHIEEGMPVIESVIRIVNEYVHLFSQSVNERLKEKVQDVLDLGHRILLHLTQNTETQHDYSGLIILAADIMPSDVVRYAAQNAEGLILLKNVTTSHISILARSMQIPLIHCDERGLFSLPDHTPLIMDGNQGTIFINPDSKIKSSYEELLRADGNEERSLEKCTNTANGKKITLLANANLLSDLDVASRLGAEGVGLYRSEFPFIIRDNFPTEEEQFRIYSQVYEKSPGDDVVFRTLDIGGDKLASYIPMKHEQNPFMGLRAIRLSLTNESIFRPQLRAMLRAGADRPLKIMFPLVSSLDDLLTAKEIVHNCIAELREEGLEANWEPKLGMMVEVPSAVEQIEDYIPHVDFLSIGTNDLIQYLLAVDRTNDQVAHLYQEHHPAVLKALARVVSAATETHTECSICGEMASSRKMLPFLLGIGLRRFSVDPRLLCQTQKAIQSIDLNQAKELAKKMLKCDQIKKVETFLVG